jgi:hypothetical protein
MDSICGTDSLEHRRIPGQYAPYLHRAAYLHTRVLHARWPMVLRSASKVNADMSAPPRPCQYRRPVGE